MKENGIEDIIIHAPYIINLANTIKPDSYLLISKIHLIKQLVRLY